MIRGDADLRDIIDNDIPKMEKALRVLLEEAKPDHLLPHVQAIASATTFIRGCIETTLEGSEVQS